MTLLDFPLEARLRNIEDRLGAIERDMTAVKVDLAVIKTRLEALPTRWMQVLFVLAILIPIYGILVTLLWTTVHH